jgi:hypothetical protein
VTAQVDGEHAVPALGKALRQRPEDTPVLSQAMYAHNALGICLTPASRLELHFS